MGRGAGLSAGRVRGARGRLLLRLEVRGHMLPGYGAMRRLRHRGTASSPVRCTRLLNRHDPHHYGTRTLLPSCIGKTPAAPLLLLLQADGAGGLRPELRDQLRAVFALSDNAAALRRLAGGGAAAAGPSAAPNGPGSVRLVENNRAHNISIVLKGRLGLGMGWGMVLDGSGGEASMKQPVQERSRPHSCCNPPPSPSTPHTRPRCQASGGRPPPWPPTS